MPRSSTIEPNQKPHHKKHKFWRRVVIILLILGVIRLALPYVVLHFVNKKLASIDGYYGHTEDINLALIRGAYVIRDVYLHKVDDDGDTTEFFSAPRVDLSVEWGALFEGKLVGEVVFEEPEVKYTLHQTIGKKAEKEDVDFIELVKDLMPLRINRFEVDHGKIHYIDETANPPLDAAMTHVVIIGENLTNEPEEGVELPASIKMSSRLYDGDLRFDVKLNPLTKIPTFDLNGKLTQTDLTNFNPIFREYAFLDVEKGNLSLYAEFAAKNNEFSGYVKPLVKDLKVVDLKEDGSPLQKAWETVVGTLGKIFENQKKEQIGAKVNLKGTFRNPDVSTLSAILSVIQNAFIKALEPTIENTINFYNMEEQPQSGLKKFLKGSDNEIKDTSPDREKNKKKEDRKRLIK